jgi:hypothetical protein
MVNPANNWRRLAAPPCRRQARCGLRRRARSKRVSGTRDYGHRSDAPERALTREIAAIKEPGAKRREYHCSNGDPEKGHRLDAVFDRVSVVPED